MIRVKRQEFFLARLGTEGKAAAAEEIAWQLAAVADQILAMREPDQGLVRKSFTGNVATDALELEWELRVSGMPGGSASHVEITWRRETDGEMAKTSFDLPHEEMAFLFQKA